MNNMIHLVFNDHLVVPDPEETERLKYAIHAHKKLQGGWGGQASCELLSYNMLLWESREGDIGPDKNFSSCRHEDSYVKSPTTVYKYNQSYFMNIFTEATHNLWTLSQWCKTSVLIATEANGMRPALLPRSDLGSIWQVSH